MKENQSPSSKAPPSMSASNADRVTAPQSDAMSGGPPPPQQPLPQQNQMVVQDQAQQQQVQQQAPIQQQAQAQAQSQQPQQPQQQQQPQQPQQPQQRQVETMQIDTNAPTVQTSRVYINSYSCFVPDDYLKEYLLDPAADCAMFLVRDMSDLPYERRSIEYAMGSDNESRRQPFDVSRVDGDALKEMIDDFKNLQTSDCWLDDEYGTLPYFGCGLVASTVFVITRAGLELNEHSVAYQFSKYLSEEHELSIMKVDRRMVDQLIGVLACGQIGNANMRKKKVEELKGEGEVEKRIKHRANSLEDAEEALIDLNPNHLSPLDTETPYIREAWLHYNAHKDELARMAAHADDVEELRVLLSGFLHRAFKELSPQALPYLIVGEGVFCPFALLWKSFITEAFARLTRKMTERMIAVTSSKTRTTVCTPQEMFRRCNFSRRQINLLIHLSMLGAPDVRMAEPLFENYYPGLLAKTKYITDRFLQVAYVESLLRMCTCFSQMRQGLDYVQVQAIFAASQMFTGGSYKQARDQPQGQLVLAVDVTKVVEMRVQAVPQGSRSLLSDDTLEDTYRLVYKCTVADSHKGFLGMEHVHVCTEGASNDARFRGLMYEHFDQRGGLGPGIQKQLLGLALAAFAGSRGGGKGQTRRPNPKSKKKQTGTPKSKSATIYDQQTPDGDLQLEDLQAAAAQVSKPVKKVQRKRQRRETPGQGQDQDQDQQAVQQSEQTPRKRQKLAWQKTHAWVAERKAELAARKVLSRQRTQENIALYNAGQRGKVKDEDDDETESEASQNQRSPRPSEMNEQEALGKIQMSESLHNLALHPSSMVNQLSSNTFSQATGQAGVQNGMDDALSSCITTGLNTGGAQNAGVTSPTPDNPQQQQQSIQNIQPAVAQQQVQIQDVPQLGANQQPPTRDLPFGTSVDSEQQQSKLLQAAGSFAQMLNFGNNIIKLYNQAKDQEQQLGAQPGVMQQPVPQSPTSMFACLNLNPTTQQPGVPQQPAMMQQPGYPQQPMQQVQPGLVGQQMMQGCPQQPPQPSSNAFNFGQATPQPPMYPQQPQQPMMSPSFQYQGQKPQVFQSQQPTQGQPGAGYAPQQPMYSNQQQMAQQTLAGALRGDQDSSLSRQPFSLPSVHANGKATPQQPCSQTFSPVQMYSQQRPAQTAVATPQPNYAQSPFVANPRMLTSQCQPLMSSQSNNDYTWAGAASTSFNPQQLNPQRNPGVQEEQETRRDRREKQKAQAAEEDPEADDYNGEDDLVDNTDYDENASFKKRFEEYYEEEGAEQVDDDHDGAANSQEFTHTNKQTPAKVPEHPRSVYIANDGSAPIIDRVVGKNKAFLLPGGGDSVTFDEFLQGKGKDQQELDKLLRNTSKHVAWSLTNPSQRKSEAFQALQRKIRKEIPEDAQASGSDGEQQEAETLEKMIEGGDEGEAVKTLGLREEQQYHQWRGDDDDAFNAAYDKCVYTSRFNLAEESIQDCFQNPDHQLPNESKSQMFSSLNFCGIHGINNMNNRVVVSSLSDFADLTNLTKKTSMKRIKGDVAKQNGQPIFDNMKIGLTQQHGRTQIVALNLRTEYGVREARAMAERPQLLLIDLARQRIPSSLLVLHGSEPGSQGNSTHVCVLRYKRNARGAEDTHIYCKSGSGNVNSSDIGKSIKNDAKFEECTSVQLYDAQTIGPLLPSLGRQKKAGPKSEAAKAQQSAIDTFQQSLIQTQFKIRITDPRVHAFVKGVKCVTQDFMDKKKSPAVERSKQSVYTQVENILDVANHQDLGRRIDFGTGFVTDIVEIGKSTKQQIPDQQVCLEQGHERIYETPDDLSDIDDDFAPTAKRDVSALFENDNGALGTFLK